jgi:hypothetical protein
VTLAIRLDHHVGAQDGVLLLAADPLEQLGLRPGSAREGTGIEGDKHWVQGRGDRLAAALAGGGDGPLADGFRVAGGGMPRPWRVKALRSDGQVVPSS